MNIYEKELLFLNKDENYTAYDLGNGDFYDIISANCLSPQLERKKTYIAVSKFSDVDFYSHTFTNANNITQTRISSNVIKLANLKNQNVYINAIGQNKLTDLIIGMSSNNVFYTTRDYFTAANITIPTGTTINDIDCNSEYSYVVGTNGFVAYSTDGINYQDIKLSSGIDLTGLNFTCISACEVKEWTSMRLSAIACAVYQQTLLVFFISRDTIISVASVANTAGLVDLANINGLFVGVSTSNRINYSTFIYDGNFQNISNIPTVSSAYIQNIKAIGDTFFIARGDNTALKSKDGQAWETVNMNLSPATVIQSMANLDNNICFLATNGTISQKGL